MMNGMVLLNYNNGVLKREEVNIHRYSNIFTFFSIYLIREFWFIKNGYIFN